MAVFHDKTITGQRVFVDEDTYTKCKLINCTIVYRGGFVVLDFEAVNCRWEFEGPALNTIRMLQALHMLPQDVSQMLVVPDKPSKPN